jgi:two-component system, LuxR family, sensor kinase FixL
MTISQRLIVLSLLLMLVFSGAFVAQRKMEMGRLSLLMEVEQRNKEEVYDAVTNLMSLSLGTLASDYSFWDEMVNFIATQDKDWARKNIDVSLDTYKANAVWLYNRNSSLVYAIDNLEDPALKSLPIPQKDVGKLFVNSPSCHFFAFTSTGLMEIYGHFVQPSADTKRQTPALGYFFCGRNLDNAYIENASKLTGTEITIAEISKEDLSGPDYSEAKVVSFSRILHDYAQEPIACLAVYAESQNIVNFEKTSVPASILSLCFSIVTLILYLFAMAIWVNVPLKQINRALKEYNPVHIEKVKQYRSEFGRVADLVGNYFIQSSKLRESEVMQRLLLDSVPEAIFGIDMNSICTFCNNTCLRLLGYTRPDELLGTNIHLRIHSKHPDGTPFPVEECRIFQACHDGKGLHVDDEMLWRADGSSFLAEYWSYPLLRDGVIVGAVVTFLDVTERKRTEGALARSEMKFRTLFDSTTDAVMLLDDNGFFDCNPATLAVFGFADREEFCSKHPADLSPPLQPCGTDSLTLSNRQIATAMEKGNNKFEWNHQRADTGKIFPAEVLLIVMELDGKPVLQAVVRDITERKQAEEIAREKVAQDRLINLNASLEQTVEALNLANQELRDFAKVVAHDLKSPIRAIVTLSEWIARDYRDQLDEPGREQITLLEQRARKLNQIVDSILVYCGVGRTPMRKETVCLKTLLDRVIEDLCIPDRIRVQRVGNWPAMLCERQRVAQVFHNLLSNAVKYNNNPDPWIRIEARQTDTEWTFSVSDNGPGIDPRYHHKLFQLFQTIEDGPQGRGTGVGLALIRKVVEDIYGGAVRLDSAAHTGSKFTLSFPKHLFVEPSESVSPLQRTLS